MNALATHTVFLTLAGSHAHGTARAGSDVDLRGVCIVPLDARLSLRHDFEQFDGVLPDDLLAIVRPVLELHETAQHGLDEKVEGVVYDLAKFLRLCVAANPNALEILFADPRDEVLTSPAWRRIHDARSLFLTRKVEQTFHGYARAQLNRIKSHRSWLLSPPKAPPLREDFGLPAHGSPLGRDDQNRVAAAIAEKVRGYGIDDLEMPRATRIAVQERLTDLVSDALNVPASDLDAHLDAVASDALGLPEAVIATLAAEKRYRAARKHWSAYQTWLRQRNPARAELEREFGYDTKHAMHLVRLMRMGIEALELQTLRVRRPDADELLAIRDGALSYDALLAETERLGERLAAAAAQTRLPEAVDLDAVDRLAVSLMVDPSGNGRA